MESQNPQTSSYILEWIIGITAFITAITGLISATFRKTDIRSIPLIKSVKKNSQIEEVLARINSDFVHARITSVLAVTDHDIPLNYQTLFSTDFQTHHIWKIPVRVSSDLSKTLTEVAESGFGEFKIKKVQHPRIKAWFDRNEIHTAYMFSIGVGYYYLNKKKQWVWLILTVNWDESEELDGNTVLKIYEYLVEVQQHFKHLSKKPFLSSPPKIVEKYTNEIR